MKSLKSLLDIKKPQGLDIWRKYGPPGDAGEAQLDVDSAATNDEELILAQILSEEIESTREAERADLGKVAAGVYPDCDYVDTVNWARLIHPRLVVACGKRAGRKPHDVLEFVRARCRPINGEVLFWMQAWFEEIHDGATDTMRAVALRERALAEAYEARAVSDLKLRAEAVQAKAKQMAETRHGKPGGSRDKQAAIREIWASGKHATRADCAEQEWEAIGMSIDTARKALRNTDDPTNWPGKLNRKSNRFA